jgi:hypothetical protein
MKSSSLSGVSYVNTKGNDSRLVGVLNKPLTASQSVGIVSMYSNKERVKPTTG